MSTTLTIPRKKLSTKSPAAKNIGDACKRFNDNPDWKSFKVTVKTGDNETTIELERF